MIDILNKAGHIEVRLAKTQEEKIEAYKLRYKYLILDYNPNNINKSGMDYLPYDDKADLLIAIDTNIKKLIGTYRLISNFDDFASHEEYDISSLRGLKVIELSRAVIHPNYRDGVTIMLLWKAILQYCKILDVNYMLGTASFYGLDIAPYKHATSYLYYNYLISDEFDIKSQGEYFPLCQMLESEVDVVKAKSELPALIKGYMRLGGKFAKDAHLDIEFDSLSTMVVVDLNNINKRYYKHLMGEVK